RGSVASTRGGARAEPEVTLVAWRFVTTLLAAVAMATAVCHLLELPPKLAYEADLYVRLHRTLYENYGRVGGPAEVLAVASALAIAWRLRGRGTTSWLTAAGAGLLLLAHATFWVVVQPANSTMLAWSLDAIPADWARWR